MCDLQVQRTQEEEVQYMSEARQAPAHYIQHISHQGHPLNPNPGMLLQEPRVHPTPQDLYVCVLAY